MTQHLSHFGYLKSDSLLSLSQPIHSVNTFCALGEEGGAGSARDVGRDEGVDALLAARIASAADPARCCRLLAEHGRLRGR